MDQNHLKTNYLINTEAKIFNKITNKENSTVYKKDHRAGSGEFHHKDMKVVQHSGVSKHDTVLKQNKAQTTWQ